MVLCYSLRLLWEVTDLSCFRSFPPVPSRNPLCLLQGLQVAQVTPSGRLRGLTTVFATRKPHSSSISRRDSSSLESFWDLRPFAAVLAPGHTSPPATKHKETGTKNSCVHARAGQNHGPEIRKDPKKSLLSLLKSREQTVGVRSKSTGTCPAHTTAQGVGHPETALQPDTLNTPPTLARIRSR